MGDLPSALPGIPALVAGSCLYLAIWFTGRGLEGGARALARTLPLLVIVPAVFYLFIVLTLRHEDSESDAAFPAARSAQKPVRPLSTRTPEPPWRPVKSEVPR